MIVCQSDSVVLAQLFKEVGILAQVKDTVGIEHDQRIFMEIAHKLGKECVHMLITAKSRADDPPRYRILPRIDGIQPLIVHVLQIFVANFVLDVC
mgnify:CR=1 FL=1